MNQFREALNGDLKPSWIIVWSHVNMGKIFDATGQRERALNGIASPSRRVTTHAVRSTRLACTRRNPTVTTRQPTGGASEARRRMEL